MAHSTKRSPVLALLIRHASWFALLALFAWVGVAQAQPSDGEEQANTAADVFPIPKDVQTIEQLFDFVEKVAGQQPNGRSEEDMIAHQRKVARTVVVVADKALSMQPNDQEALQSYYFKLQALQVLQQLGEPQAEQALADTIEAAKSDSRPNVAALGLKFMVESSFRKWPTLDESEKASLIKTIVDFIQQQEAGPEHVQMLLTVVDFLANANDDELAKQLLAELEPHFRASSNKDVQGLVPMLEGISRRLNLLGQKIDIKGTLLDGTPLDWAAYRGKVVLVDFWATWCGPCRAEVPNVLKMYAAYHDKGFDVLGISLDSRPEQAAAYLKQMNIPWVTLFSKNEQERGWQQPMAVYYGVTGIPRAILVDRDGTVVHMNARGENLERELRRMLGEPLAKAQLSEEAIVQQVAKPAVQD